MVGRFRVRVSRGQKSSGGQRYRSVGMLRVRSRQSVQAGVLGVRTGKHQNQEGKKRETG
jgi:hypothetical protein